MTAVGACGELAFPGGVFSTDLDELTTFATAYALVRFMNPSNPQQIGTVSRYPAGLANAASTIPNFVNFSDGTPAAFLSDGDNSPAVLDSLANMLVPCVVSSGVNFGGHFSSLACNQMTALMPEHLEPADTLMFAYDVASHPVIAGEPFASYMGVPGIEAEHVTLVLEHVSPRTEIQLLRYHHPDVIPDAHIRELNKVGMNHICFAVDDIETEVAKLRASGFRTRNEIMDFHSRKLVFIEGPEDVTVELSQWR
ncbi:MAG: VOC family protein [Candidatus Binataceae bacterium]